MTINLNLYIKTFILMFITMIYNKIISNFIELLSICVCSQKSLKKFKKNVFLLLFCPMKTCKYSKVN